jgi:hypothetical protein
VPAKEKEPPPNEEDRHSRSGVKDVREPGK